VTINAYIMSGSLTVIAQTNSWSKSTENESWSKILMSVYRVIAWSMESVVCSSASKSSSMNRSFSMLIARQTNGLVAAVLLIYREMIDMQISKGAEEGRQGPCGGRETKWMKGGKLDLVRSVAYDCMLCRRNA
jgi:hypothetical protein